MAVEKRKKTTLSEDIFGTISVRVVTMVLGLVTGAIAARMLGPHDRGLLALGLVLPATIVMLTKLGMPQANVFLIRRERSSTSDVCSNAFVTALLCGAVLMVAAWVCRRPLQQTALRGVSDTALLLALPMIPLLLIQSFFIAIVQALGQFRFYNRLMLFGAALMTAGTGLALFMLGGRLLAALTVSIVVAAIVDAALLFVVWRQTRFAFRLNPDYLMRALRFGIKSHFQTLTQHLHLRLDIYMVAYFLNPTQVAFYSLAAKFAELILDVPDAVGMAVYPRMASRDDRGIHRLTADACRRTLLITATMGAVICLIGRPLIVTWYGEAFRPAADPLPYIVVGVCLMSIFVLLTRNFTSRDKQVVNITASGIALLINIALNVYLIPHMGIIGAALATSVSYTVATVILAGAYLRESGLSVLDLTMPQRADWEFFLARLTALVGKVFRPSLRGAVEKVSPQVAP